MGNPFGPTHNSRLQVEAGLTRRVNEERDAGGTFAALRAQIEAIEETPGTNVAVGAYLPFSSEILYVQQLGYEGRNVIFMIGERAGTKVRLVMHHSQMQVMLVPVQQGSEKAGKVLYIVPSGEDAARADEAPKSEE